jgi:hypothetical protein
MDYRPGYVMRVAAGATGFAAFGGALAAWSRGARAAALALLVLGAACDAVALWGPRRRPGNSPHRGEGPDHRDRTA